MPIIYFEGPISLERFEQACSEHNLDPHKVVFIFPGKPSHHSIEANLFSIKSGQGLANVASENGKKGYPTLSLPIISMENWSTDKQKHHIVQKAIADLYCALGAGFSFMLPVREYNTNQTYFSVALLGPKEDKEPRFWGETQLAPNPSLSFHYIIHLNRFHQFSELPYEKHLSASKEEKACPFFCAYMHGFAMQSHDQWLQCPTSQSDSAKKGLDSFSLFSKSQHNSSTDLSGLLETSSRSKRSNSDEEFEDLLVTCGVS